MSKVILTVGIPACGKSTWARQQSALRGDVVVTERDIIREMQGFPPFGSTEQERLVTKIQRGMIETALLEGMDVYVSDTNINKTFRKNLIKFAHEHGADVEIKVFSTPLDECLRRNVLRDRVVPESVIRKMHQQMNSQLDNGSLVEGVIPAPVFDAYQHADGKPQVIVVDLDGTVAGHNRSPYDYDKVETDSPIENVIAVVQALSDQYKVIFVSGRPDSCREATVRWIDKHIGLPEFRLLMRETGDQRPDYIVKNEIYDDSIIPNYNVVMAFDDRDQVVRHVRKRGITVAQVAPGRF